MSKKQKLDVGNRTFNIEWERGFSFISVKDKIVCLLVKMVLNSLNESSANQHYLTHKYHKCAKLGESCQLHFKILKEKLYQHVAFSAFMLLQECYYR